MNHNHIPTEREEQIAAEMNVVFAEQMTHFKNACGALHDIESNLPTIGNEAFKAALLSLGHAIQTDDGAEWRHDLDLSQITSICHRRTETGLEFAIVECLSLPFGERKEVLNSGHNVRDVLLDFIHDQKQVLNLWKDDVKAQMKEHLEKKHPYQDMSVVIESFEIKMSRVIAENKSLTQNHGIRI